MDRRRRTGRGEAPVRVRSSESAEKSDAIQVALRYLNLRDRTEHELRSHLQRKGFAPRCVDTAVEKLRGWGYLDDERMALRWGQARIESGQWGPFRLARELARRGVSEDLVEDVLRRLMVEREEASLARTAAARYLRGHPGVEGALAVRRLAGYLGRRGFSGEVIGRILREQVEHVGAPENSEI